MATKNTPAKKTAPRKSAPRKAAARPEPEPDYDDDFAADDVLDEDVVDVDDYDDYDDAADEAEERAANAMVGTDMRETADQSLLDEIPEELRFSTDSGERSESDRVPVALDGHVYYLYKPARSLLILLSNAFMPGADPRQKIGAMMDLVNNSMDPAGRAYIRQMMFAPDNSFDDAVLGRLVGVILDRWSDMSTEDLDLSTQEPVNRQQRRALEKKRRTAAARRR